MKKLFKHLALCAAVAFCAMLFFGIDGSAYIDPSVGGALITAISGLVIAVGAVIGIYFRRAKKKLNIDENRNKEVESDEIEAAPEATETAPEAAPEATETAAEENND